MIRWTPDKIKHLHKAMNAGKSTVEYAKETGMSPSAIIGLARREFGGWGPGRERLDKTPERKREVINDYVHTIDRRMYLTRRGKRYLRPAWKNPNVSTAQMAARMGIGRGRILIFAKEMGLPMKASHYVYRKRVVKRREPPPKLTPWPDNVQFHDHPNTVTNSRLGYRYIAGEG